MAHLQIVQIGADGEPRASTEAIAAGYKNSHEAVMKLVNRYKSQLETFGKVGFEIRPSPDSKTGQMYKLAMLNERQAGFLISLMRNNVEVVDFKLRMAHEFWRMGDALANRDVTLLTRRILLEQKNGTSLALARIGSGLMLDRKGDLPGIRTERALLRAVMEPGLFPEELDKLVDQKPKVVSIAHRVKRSRSKKVA